MFETVRSDLFHTVDSIEYVLKRGYHKQRGG
jgi:hypothetical protein